MELRWYQTYNKFGRDSFVNLQFRENEDENWQDVKFVREREDDPYDEPEE